MNITHLRRTALAVAVSGLSVTPSLVSAVDFGRLQETLLNASSIALFGFGRPVQNSSEIPSFIGTGKEAVEVAKGLQVNVISSQVGGVP